MKVLCNACEAAEARVMCCADEAALCWACDERVHAANKLAGKHLRVPLISSPSSNESSPSVPKCDICQESSGYFFCLEDRALLCRNCDVTIHSANPYVSSHQRFLLTGVQVALESTQNPNLTPNPSSTPRPIEKEKPPQTPFERSSSMSGQVSWDSEFNNMTGTAGTLPDWPVANAQQYNSDLANKSISKRSSNNFVFSGREGGGTTNKMVPGGSLFRGNMPDWPLDEFFGFREYNNNNGGFGFTEHGSSKADSGKLGSSESSSLYKSNDDEMECLGQVPEISSFHVPEMPSPPTGSGLHFQRDLHFCPSNFDDLASVPDISSSSLRCYTQCRLKSRRRQ